MKRHLDRLKKTATSTLSAPESRQLLMANSRENKTAKTLVSSDKPVAECHAVKYPPGADVRQYDYSLGPMMVEVDRTLTQEFYQSNLHQTMFNQHIYY